MLFAHKCGGCGNTFPAELGDINPATATPVTIRNLCAECEWMQLHVWGRQINKVFVRTLPEFVPLTAKDQPLVKHD